MNTSDVRRRLWPTDDDFVRPMANEIKDVGALVDEVETIRKKLLDEAEKKCADISEADIKHNLGPGIYFRGQASFGDALLPSIGRKDKKAEKKHVYCGRWIRKFAPNQERNLLHRFRRRSYREFGRLLSPWEALFLARHYGLPTRLLDWTDNPLVALYFASIFKEKPKSDGAVWAFARFPDEGYDLNVLSNKSDSVVGGEYKYGKEFKFDFEGVKIIYPFDNSGRLIAQQGIFTIQKNPRKALTMYHPSNFIGKEKDFDIRRIYKWRVRKKEKGDIIQALHDRGINDQALFPDIAGLAEGILHMEIFRSGEPIK